MGYDPSPRTKRNPTRMSLLYELVHFVFGWGIFNIAFWFIGMCAIYFAIGDAARDLIVMVIIMYGDEEGDEIVSFKWDNDYEHFVINHTKYLVFPDVKIQDAPPSAIQPAPPIETMSDPEHIPASEIWNTVITDDMIQKERKECNLSDFLYEDQGPVDTSVVDGW